MSFTLLGKKERGEIAIKPPERRAFAAAFGMTIEDFDSVWRGAKVHDRPPPAKIPVINRGPAGVVYPYDGTDQNAAAEYNDPWESVDRGDPMDPQRYIDDALAFALIIIGDSMEPTLYDGDIAIFSPCTVPKPTVKLENGRIVFVRFTPESGHDGVTVARWFQQPDGSIQFVKDNRAYAPCNARPEHIAQIACCIEKRSRRL